MSGPTVAFATLGCRLNQVESQEMRALVEQAGYRAVEPGEAAQVYVVNTCTVTSRADFSDRQVIRRILRASPEARVVVTGCLAQTDEIRRNTGCRSCWPLSRRGTGRKCTWPPLRTPVRCPRCR